jgi:hypothetical protein
LWTFGAAGLTRCQRSKKAEAFVTFDRADLGNRSHRLAGCMQPANRLALSSAGLFIEDPSASPPYQSAALPT